MRLIMVSQKILQLKTHNLWVIESPATPTNYRCRTTGSPTRMMLMRYPKRPLRMLSRSINLIFRKRLRAVQRFAHKLSERKVS